MCGAESSLGLTLLLLASAQKIFCLQKKPQNLMQPVTQEFQWAGTSHDFQWTTVMPQDSRCLMITCVCLLFVGNTQACNRPTLSPPKFSISAFNVIKDSVRVILMHCMPLLCYRLCPEGCVFEPDLLGGQEVTCLCKTPRETNGEDSQIEKK